MSPRGRRTVRRVIFVAVAVVAIVVVVLVALVAVNIMVLPSNSPAPLTITSVHLVIEEQKTASTGYYWFGPNSLNYTYKEGYPIQVSPGGTWSVVWAPITNYDDVPHTVYNVTVSSIPQAPSGMSFKIAGTSPALHYTVPTGDDDGLLSITISAPSDPGATFAVTLVVNTLTAS